jgi:endoglucanase
MKKNTIISFFLFLHVFLHAQGLQHTHRIRVDQFGYLPDAMKVAVIADPQIGFDSDESYVPGNVLEVRRESDGAVMHSGAPMPWNDGAVHTQSGDWVWWFDFSSVTEPGEYRIFDIENQTYSDRFRIAEDVYAEVLRHAVRMFYYQRADFAKEEPYAEAPWVDGAAHTQDEFTRPIWDPDNAGLERDLRGGWFDAGDYNKYTEWTARAIIELLLAYVQRPDVFTDDFGIPESGNGIPDLLDEVKWGMDWVLRMQEPNGSMLGKVSVTEHQSASPPSTDDNPRFYGPVSTEATAASAAAFALGATVFESVGLVEYAATLENAAISAWNWTMDNPAVQFDNTGFLSVSPERDEYQTLTNRIMAAVMLFERTGDTAYRDFVDGNLMQIQPIQWWYFYPFEAEIQKALAHYAQLPNATPASVQTIRERMAASINGEEFLGAWNDQVDAYRSYLKTEDYVWGSNRAKAQVGTLFTNVNLLGLNPENADTHRDAAMGYLHYIHGVNPLGMVYLSNMYNAGATRSVNEIYHHWFTQGSDWSHALDSLYGPAPGFLAGGPNRDYTGSISWIRDQPPQKAYKDWNGLWPEESWEISEPDINYQTGYIHLLSALMPLAQEGETFTLNVQAENGTVQRSPNRILYNEGSTVTLTATGDNGFAFSEWQGDLSGSENPVTLTMDSDKTITAFFVAVPVYELMVIHGSGSGAFSEGFVTAIHADPAPAGFTFEGWTGDIQYLADASAASTSVTMPGQAISVTATYTDLLPPPDALVVYSDDVTLITGTWGDGLQELDSGGFEGDKQYRWDYSVSGAWAGMGLNLDNWGTGPVYDVSGMEFLRLAVEGPSAAQHELYVKLVSAGGGEGPNVRIPQTEPYGLVTIPLADLKGDSGLDLTSIREIQFGVGGVESGTGTVYFDEIMFVAAEVPLTPFEQWLQDNNVEGDIVEIDGAAYSAMALYTMGATRGEHDSWQNVLRIENLTIDTEGLPILSYPEVEGRVYQVFWTHDLSVEADAWQSWNEANPPTGSPVFFKVEVSLNGE